MLKKGFLGVLIILCLVLIWQLIKPYDYSVSFKTKAISGTINQTLKLWNQTLDKGEILAQKSLNEINQSIEIDNTEYLLNWQFQEENKDLIQVKIKVKSKPYSFTNRLAILFTKSKSEDNIETTITDFVEVLNQHLKNIKVTIEGEAISPEKYCAYVPIKTTQLQKAGWMMKTYGLLNGTLIGENVKLDGRPRIEITHWDTKTDSIYFNFCFPVIKHDSLPKHPKIKYKILPEAKSIKAIYNGNYITSDRAWYHLIKYANANNLDLNNKAIEVFHNNPNMGGDALQWKTEVYIPIKTN